MKAPDFLSVLADRFSDFVTFRRLGGIDPRRQTALLRFFDRFLDQEGFRGRWPTPKVIERYVFSIRHLHPATRASRFSVVRQFCRYLSQFEPQCSVPERLHLRRPSYVPHIYSESEVRALLQAAQQLPPVDSLRPKMYFTLFGLLYTAGLRSGEAFRLNLSDVDLKQHFLFIHEGKFGKSRWVPVSPSTSAMLQRFVEARKSLAPALPESPFFVTCRGHRLYPSVVHLTFQQVLQRCGLRDSKSRRGPRLHDLRHSFACNRVLAWYRQGKDVQALLPALATYLGHVRVTSTQVYLHATAELREEANQRFLRNYRQNISPEGEGV
jgi:site-specific recombinase XerD